MNYILDSKYVILEEVGHGSTCYVYKGFSLEDKSKKLLAIKLFQEQAKKFYEKEIHIKDLLPSHDFLQIFSYGSGIIRKVNNNINNEYLHNSLCSLENFKGEVLYIIEELAENGELFDYVYELKQGFSEKIAARIFKQILNYIKILHENRIAHCDIKPENIIIGNDFNIKLIDFGFSEILEKEDNFIYNYKGSEVYASPEVKNKNMNGYDGIKNDIFSLAVLLFVITIGRFPFDRCCYSDRKYRLIMNKKYREYWCYFYKYNLSDEFKDLINNLFCYDPSERLSINEILEHPWIKINTNGNMETAIENFDEEVEKELRKRKAIIQDKKAFS